MEALCQRNFHDSCISCMRTVTVNNKLVVDEELDRQVLKVLQDKDLDRIASLPLARLQSGSSEIRNWIIAAEAVRDLDLDWVRYVPGQRTPALTGTGLAFAAWKTLD